MKRKAAPPGVQALRVLLVLFLSASLPVAVVKLSGLFPDRSSLPDVTPTPGGGEFVPATDVNLPATPVPLASPVGSSVLQTWNFLDRGLVVDSALITKYGRHLVISFTDGSLLVHSFDTGQEQLFKPPVKFDFLQLVDGISTNSAGILMADYSPNQDGNVSLWQVLPGGESRLAADLSEANLFLTDLAISPDGETLAVGYNNGEIRLFGTQAGTLAHVIPAHHDFVMALEFSWDNRFLLTDSFSFDPFTHVFRVSDGEKIATLSTESYEPGRIAFSPDNRLASVASLDGTRLFETATWTDLGYLIPTMDGIFTCDSRGLIAFSEGGEQVYSVTSGEVVRSRLPAESTLVNCLFDGRTVSLNVDLPNDSVTLFLLEP